MDHPNINKILDQGLDGILGVDAESTSEIAYVVLEYAPGVELFKLCQKGGDLGEHVSRYFMF